jgi:hypothetical protein
VFKLPIEISLFNVGVQRAVYDGSPLTFHMTIIPDDKTSYLPNLTSLITKPVFSVACGKSHLETLTLEGR